MKNSIIYYNKVLRCFIQPIFQTDNDMYHLSHLIIKITSTTLNEPILNLICINTDLNIRPFTGNLRYDAALNHLIPLLKLTVSFLK